MTTVPEQGSGSTPSDTPAEAQALGDEIARLAGHIAAATCRFLVLLGEFDEREGWHGGGILSCAHWLSWRCGMGVGAAREHVRVARALRDLPRVVEAFASGRLSYSKVRALTRVAEPDTEEDLLEVALHASAGQLERILRGVRQVKDLAEARVVNGRRALTWRWSDDGSLQIRVTLPADDGALVVQALEQTRHRTAAALAGAPPPLEQADPAQDTFGPPAVVDPDIGTRRSLADALVELCSQPDAVADDGPRTGRRAETVLHVTLDDLRAEESTGAPPVTTTEEAGGTSATPPPRVARPHRRHARSAALPPQRLATSAGPRLEGGPALHPETARRLTCDAGIVVQVHARGIGTTGRTIDVGMRTRRPNAALVRALWSRDGGCRYPGCERRSHLHAHHVRHWAHGGPTVLSNLVLLCGTHHRLLHEGGYLVQMNRDGDLTVIDRNGARVHPSPRTPGDVASCVHVARAPVGPDTLMPPDPQPRANTSYVVGVLAGNWQVRRERGEDPVPEAPPNPGHGGPTSRSAAGRTSHPSEHGTVVLEPTQEDP
ncbi:HNH endonuclease signature motif containing protein [Georgenia faecalis]|uniref:HNH endonuclease signature motif containing protein n=1 Tax=Georgenia faecalis TaxID=2483799 RepID=UPI0013DFA949|nr:HNH endonuclease signature motif containing protein [Georgenia faecalis]